MIQEIEFLGCTLLLGMFNSLAGGREKAGNSSLVPVGDALILQSYFDSLFDRIGRRVKVYICGIYCPELDMMFAASPHSDSDKSSSNSASPPLPPSHRLHKLELCEAARLQAGELWERNDPG